MVEVLAGLTDLGMAWAAYAVACRKHPESFVVLAIKAQILRRSDKPPRFTDFCCATLSYMLQTTAEQAEKEFAGAA